MAGLAEGVFEEALGGTEDERLKALAQDRERRLLNAQLEDVSVAEVGNVRIDKHEVALRTEHVSCRHDFQVLAPGEIPRVLLRVGACGCG